MNRTVIVELGMDEVMEQLGDAAEAPGLEVGAAWFNTTGGISIEVTVTE